MGFENLAGLWALSALVPFIIIYLIRPKPVEKVIPSLMFVMQERKTSREASFLRKLLENLLFILQLLALAGFAFAISSPFIKIPYSVASENTVIVLDVSASMQAKDGVAIRFDKALSTAKANLDGRISIILAENNPLVILDNGKKDEALSILGKISPKSTSTNLGDALLTAEDLLGNKKGRVIVISDFITTEGPDIMVAKSALISKGNVVDFFDVGSKAENVGIVELDAGKHETIVGIRNYNKEEEAFNVKLIKGNDKISEQQIRIEADSKEKLTFETPTELSRIELDVKDDLAVDNVAYLSAPSKKKIRVLFITNEKTNSIKAALEASPDVELEVRNPPVTNAYNIDHDVVVLSDISKDLFVKADFIDLKSYVEKGGNLIIAAQDGLDKIDSNELRDLMPVALAGRIEERTTVCADVINEFTKQFEEEKCFAVVSGYLKTSSKEGTFAIASTKGNSTIIVLKERGIGRVIYYGIIDGLSDFKTLTSYPIFWSKLLNFLVQTEDINDYNFRTGDILAVKEQTVKTPSADIETSKIILDEAGVYELEDKKIAVNLINEGESNIAGEEKELKLSKESLGLGKIEEKRNFNFEIPLLVLVFLIVIFELFYIKIRGDL